MKLSKISDNITITPHKGFHFIKNTEDKREAQPIIDGEEVREKGIHVVVVAHIGQAKTALLEILQKHDFTGEIILVGNDDTNRAGYIGPKSFEEQLLEMAQIPMIITARPMTEDNEIFLVSQTQHKKFQNNSVPKVQKSKAIHARKHSQKKK